MSKKYYETDQFKSLNDEWSKKLEDSGFDDIEKTETETIIRPQEFYTEGKYSGGIDYYQYCQKILREYPFKRDIDQVIFELHAEGRSDRDIVEYLKHRSYRPFTQQNVNYIIKTVKERFGRKA